MGPSAGTVDVCLTRLGHYRVQAAQKVALEGEPDGISGALLLSLGLRESGLRNINNPAETDHGCFQISELYHPDFLQAQPGCPAGSWRVAAGHRAIENGYCPRYTPALSYANRMLRVNRGVGIARKAPDPVRFSVAAYNAGVGGALAGLEHGDVDKFTTGGDYSAWVLAARSKVNAWLGEHPNWKVTK